MKTIPLTNGGFSLVDDDIYDSVCNLTWYQHNGYIKRTDSSKFLLHHVVIGKPENGLEVDHINGDKSDNRKSNLRFCKHTENVMNRSLYKNNNTGLKGVSWHKTNKKYQAQIRKDNKQYYLGSFDNAMDAALVYNNYAKEFFGEFARLNIIN